MKLSALRKFVRISIGILVGGAALAHFINAELLIRLVPDALQAHREAVNVTTGVLQTAVGEAFLVPRLCAGARWITIALLVVTLPAAIGQVIYPATFESIGPSPTLAAFRVLAQLLMIALIWWATKPDDPRQAEA